MILDREIHAVQHPFYKPKSDKGMRLNVSTGPLPISSHSNCGQHWSFCLSRILQWGPGKAKAQAWAIHWTSLPRHEQNIHGSSRGTTSPSLYFSPLSSVQPVVQL